VCGGAMNLRSQMAEVAWDDLRLEAKALPQQETLLSVALLVHSFPISIGLPNECAVLQECSWHQFCDASLPGARCCGRRPRAHRAKLSPRPGRCCASAHGPRLGRLASRRGFLSSKSHGLPASTHRPQCGHGPKPAHKARWFLFPFQIIWISSNNSGLLQNS
jgi:hypothetical protein